MKLPISVLIHTLNEEKNIRNCLESVKWAAEIIVVDMHSEDRTVEIAKKYGAHIYYHGRLDFADPARQFGLEKATHEWCLSIDADEMVPVQLYQKIKEIMAANKADVVFIPHRNFFFGTELKGGGWGPLQNHHGRLFKKSKAYYTNKVHDFFRIQPDARVVTLKDPSLGFIHFNALTVCQFIEKLNRYTTIEAEHMLLGEKKPHRFIDMVSPFFADVKDRFIAKRGFRDKSLGYGLAMLMYMYRLVSYMKYRVMKRVNSKDTETVIQHHYQNLADDIIQTYNQL